MSTLAKTPRFTKITLASASAGPFDLSFRLFDEDGLKVYVDGEVRTDWTLSSSFTDGYDDDASITFNTDLSIGQVLIIDAKLTAGRGQDYLNGPGLVDKANNELGRVWSAIADMQRDVARSVRLLDRDSEPLTPTAGALLIIGDDLSVEAGPDAGDIEDAQANAAAAQAARDEAVAAAVASPTVPQEFGAEGDGVTDDTTAMQNWLNSGSALRLPAGIYKVSAALTKSTAVSIFGDGAERAVIRWTSAAASTGIAITLPDDASNMWCDFADFGLETEKAGEGTAIAIDGSANIDTGVIQPRGRAQLRARNVRMAGKTSSNTDGWDIGFDLVSLMGTFIHGCHFLGKGAPADPHDVDSTAAVKISGAGAPVVHQIDTLEATWADYGVWADDTEGLFVTNSNLVAVSKGIVFEGTAVESQFQCSDNHINAYVTGIELSNCDQPNIHHNLIYSRNEISTNVIGVDVKAGCQFGMVKDNIFNETGTSVLKGIRVAGNNIVLEGNEFEVTDAIDVLAAATNTVIRDQVFRAVTGTRIADAGTTTWAAWFPAFNGDIDDIATGPYGVQHHRLGGSATNVPSGVTKFGSDLTTYCTDADTGQQVLRDIGSGLVMTRRKTSGTWGVWLATGGIGYHPDAVMVDVTSSRNNSTGYQNATDYFMFVSIMVGTGGTLQLSPDNSAWTTVGNWGTGFGPLTVNVPPGWYYRFTVKNSLIFELKEAP